MRAIQYNEFGDYDVLSSVDVPTPVPADGQALVRLTLAGVNPLDDTVRRGKLPAAAVRPLPIRPGGFGVGVLTEPGATALPAGTRVVLSGGRYGVGADGTWAEYIAVDPRHVLPIPDDVDDTAAAALTAATGHLTAYLALTELAGFRPGQSVLAPGVGGGVGQGGVEIARVLGAGAAITTATTTAKAERGRALGFEVIDLSTESLRDGVHRLTSGRGVDVVLDGVGGPVTGAALGALAVDGTLVSIGYTASTRTEIDVTDLIWKNAHIHGFRFALFSPEQINAANTRLLELVARKEITPLVDRVFPLEEAAQAQRHLAEGSPFGRVLLAI
ncbi:NADPH:quinone reductase-like Zn-dependent oxidoreductase [Amycolatopsis lexingtonensis]|uniref:NADPH:quinone reductase-like Zn-dependent oxidoreductase n=1 Tax=Amycolatopsis lexingtonensis TaxID=218822 RepID=A0ABR9HR05_9PSEU|nr:zinc-binding alcohol dehydrogenase family protein [Amycolatopsis lexingtonensis]MBE1493358.1 NADPH:quinone reductase-like Zn-dependent oxidoreductase [Amycolatopsis lexingtonensis]